MSHSTVGAPGPASTQSSPPSGERAHRDGDDRAPVRARGVQLFGEMRGSGYRAAPALVRRTDGQTITLSPLLYRTLDALADGHSWDSLAHEVSMLTDRHLTADDVQYLVDEKLAPLGLVVAADGAEPSVRKNNPLLALKLKVVITDEHVTRRITGPFAALFAPAVAIPVLLAFAAISWWVLVEKGLASAVHQAVFQPGMVLALWAMIVLSAAFHEFGHAAACRYGGATPGVMGAGLYIVWPAFYTEVTDSYRLGRGGRLRVDLGGLYFNAIFTVLSWALWWVLRWDALLLLVVAQHLQMVRQLAPFIRADGYHIVADLIGVPDLFSHIKPTLAGVLPRRWRPAGQPPLKRWARSVVVLWVVTVVPLLVAMMGAAVVLLPRLAATAWAGIAYHRANAAAYWSAGDLAGFVMSSLAAVLVALPVLSVVYLLSRMVRRTVRRVWVATTGSRLRRAGAALLGAGVLAALVWAWWPAEQYRPIDPQSRGALADLPDVTPLAVADRRRQEQEVAGAATAPAAARLVATGPTPTVPAALSYFPPAPVQVGPFVVPDVLISGTGAVPPVATTTPLPVESPTPPVPVLRDPWPFPFDPPEAPLEGDNRAMAVNTVDDTVITDLAVSWAIVTASRVEQNNEAWALASCQRCGTRAVAFQVLLMLPSSNVVAPVNAAIAYNQDCDACLTEAIAVQLVLTVTDIPSAEAQALVEEAMDRVEALSGQLASLSATQIYTLLQGTQAQILQVLQDDHKLPGTAVSPGLPAPDASAPPSGPIGDPSPTVAASPPAEPSPSAQPSPSAEPSPTTEPTTGPTPEATPTEPAPTESAPASPTDEPTPDALPGSDPGETAAP
jgi:putative peptide zinc metalloprotease protein